MITSSPVKKDLATRVNVGDVTLNSLDAFFIGRFARLVVYKFFCFAVFVSGTFDHECFAWSTTVLGKARLFRKQKHMKY